ncbi:hypothetical protein GY21_15610 [Cryobacterium roopkundense]|uniref:Maltokinase n=1 Tax=Cryobacterium roopkundense TaxID=1001240 RepID=A0A099J4K4_9MICO|nr:hypothetical protein GY21_15610 [Cryobacterium roopkundense]
MGEEAPEYLNRWVLSQRWFSSASRSPVLRIVGRWTLPTPHPGVEIQCLLVRDTAGQERALHQIPLTERTVSMPSLADALIAIKAHRDGTSRFVYDAPHDPAYASALLRFMLQQESAPDFVDVSATTVVQGKTIEHGNISAAHPTVIGSHVLVGEQSNTSIIFELVDDELELIRPVICKVFRAIHHGDNPDVVVQSALARAGSRFIPEPMGYVAAEWPDSIRFDGRASGHLVFAQEFFPDVPDAWRTALLAATAGEDFTDEARRLGRATAGVHSDLAAALPTFVATPRIMVALVTGMLDRFRRAIADVPDLAALRTDVESIFARALTVPWPRLQHIHGDLHLGQVLDVPERGWIMLDFEGEPLRTVADRGLPDAPLRDVAGMLRSFSYVAGTVTRAHPEQDPARLSAWASASRRAFLQGYGETSQRICDDHDPLLDAFELDKAIYETVYETRNRPDWLPLPLGAVQRLATSYARSRNDHD